MSKHIWKKILQGLLLFGGACLVIGICVFLYLIKDLPEIHVLGDYKPNIVSTAFSDAGEPIAEFYIEKRIVKELDEMPPYLLKAFLSAEDSKFYKHSGIDYLSIARALYRNIQAGGIREGGSTITQQVAKSFFLTPERRISRKIREAVLATRIEKYLSKDEILHLYLNQIYFGHGAYGVQAASELYFNKDVTDLTLSESAVLAGLPKAPNTYSPIRHPERSKKNQGVVLKRMLEENYINRETYDEAMAEPLRIETKKVDSLWSGPYFTEYVRQRVAAKYGEDVLNTEGLQIYTTMNVQMQLGANKAITDGLRAHDKRRGYRGVIKTLKSIEEIESFTKEQDELLAKRPLTIDRFYEAMVTEVNAKTKTIKINIGSTHGVIKERDYKWAELYNPTGEPDGGKKTKVLKLFKSGDIIQVIVKKLTSKPDSVTTFKLEQEPLAEAAIYSIEPATGHVKALSGGSNFRKTKFNRATQAKRQPGSAFKPVIYSAAIDSGFTTATIVVDSPLIYENKIIDTEDSDTTATTTAAEGDEEKKTTWQWKPRNFEEKFYGPTTIRTALTKSRNVVTIKVLQEVGVRKAIKYARKLGITSPLASDLSLALGSSAITLEEMTRAFATFENMGVRPEPLYITKIIDRDGNVLEENTPAGESVLTPETAYIMTSLLAGVVESGTGWRVRVNLKRPAAGKTGTTNNLNDAWFVGFVPGLATGAWIGYDSERPLGHHETGSKAASPIWINFMKEALKDTVPVNFPIPDGVEFVQIDKETGCLAGPETLKPIFEVFKTGTAPGPNCDSNLPINEQIGDLGIPMGDGILREYEPLSETELSESSEQLENLNSPEAKPSESSGKNKKQGEPKNPLLLRPLSE
jgi:penicillin-binding protein 1A